MRVRAIVVPSTLVAAIASASIASAQCDSFVFNPAQYATGSNPGSVAFGDLNGDTKLDIAVSDSADETVAVLFGAGGGVFAPAVLFPAGRVPRAVAIGDVDLDGDLDLVVANYGIMGGSGWQDYGFTVLWNDGAGGFASSTFVALPSGEIQASDVALGDLDLDGDLEVVLTEHGSGYLHSKVASFKNDGTGNFGAAALASTGYDPVSLALGDMDGDGALDAVTANSYSGTVSVLHGNRDGTFGIGYSHATGPNAMDVALGDFDGDGLPDGAVAYRYGVHVLRNTAGQFTWLATLSAGLFPDTVAFADLDGDHRLDLVAMDEFGDQMFVWMGDGAGNFAPRTQMPIGNAPVAVVAADVDADTDLDLGVALASAGGVSIVKNDCPLSTYCVAKPNSLGCSPAISWTGTPALGGADDFHVIAMNELAKKSGVAFFGVKIASLPFAGGTLCVKPPLVRTNVQSSGGSNGCTGGYDFHAANAWFAAHGWSAGTELFAQYWARDPSHPDGSGVSLSNGLRFILQP